MSSQTTLPIVTALCVAAALIGYSFYQRHGGASGTVSPVVICIAVSVIFVVPAIYDILRRLKNRNKGQQ